MRYETSFRQDTLLSAARQRTGLHDFGPDHFLEPLGVLTQAIVNEARLNEAGVAAQQERLINALSNRLRKQRLFARHPEIRDEEVQVAVVIIGLPRTGSTMLHRLLCASPRATATRWWETIFPLSRREDDDRDIAGRQADAARLARQLVESSAGFEAIHPLDPYATDEELPLIEQSFVSNIPESMMYVPGYGEWLLNADQSLAYGELIDWLRILQWQDPARRGRKWILKAPHHLTAVATVLEQFPQAVIAMTHRRVDHLMGSWYSMVASLTGGNTDHDFSRQQARHWTARLKRNLEDMLAVRALHEDRFIDIHYRGLVQAPLDHARRTFAAAGLPDNDQTDLDAWSRWLAENKRDNRPSHTYHVEDYGITPAELQRYFAFYSDRFDADR